LFQANENSCPEKLILFVEGNKDTIFNLVILAPTQLISNKFIMEGHHQSRHIAAKRPISFFPLALTLTVTFFSLSIPSVLALNPPISSNAFVAFSSFAAAASAKSNIIPAGSVTLAERRQHVTWFAESHTDWGFRYSLGDKSLEDGFDCSGFVSYVLGYFDIKTKRSSSEQFTDGKQIPVSEARNGDLVFFGGKNSISHVAVVVSNDDKGLVVVHSTCTRGIVRENITESKYWRPKLRSVAVNIIGD
jgi:cell wall-associated NlpC family hydrolase